MDHYYTRVPGWASFTELYAQVVADAPSDLPSKFVEIGSWLGRSAAFMGVEIMNSRKPIRLHCIDPWIDGGPDLKETKYYRELQEPPLMIFSRNTHAVRDVIEPHAGHSQNPHLVSCFADHSIDFLMIDGDHSYEPVKADIAGWLPKMKAGALIAGDDWLWPGVNRAFKEAFGEACVPVIKKHHPDYRKSVAYVTVRLP